MPPKYSHVKKRSAAGLLKPSASTPSNLIKEDYDPRNYAHNANLQHLYHHHIQLSSHHFPMLGVQPNSVLPNLNGPLSEAMTAVAHLERAIARILLLRFEWDIARLYSTRIHSVALVHLPVLVAQLAQKGGPGWVAMNADSEDIKDFFRSVIGMDMREAGERVATKSVLWSYTVLRRFALAHSVSVCDQRGLHSARLLPHYADLKHHLDFLEHQPTPIFEKPTFLKGLDHGFRLLEETCVTMGMDLGIELGQNYDPHIPYLDANGNWIGEGPSTSSGLPTTMETRIKLRIGYARLVQTLWRVAREFDVRGYGQVLREKLTIKWCECGCSTEHLGEVCERTVREEEEDREREGFGIWGGGELTAAAYAPITSEPPPPPVGSSKGTKKGTMPVSPQDRERIYARLKVLKEKEWDGRGSGVYGWETEREEDIWEVELDFGAGKNRTKQAAEVEVALQSKNEKPRKKVKAATKPLDKESESKDRKGKGKAVPPGERHAEEEAQMTIGELMEWRFVKAEAEKEQGNVAYRAGRYEDAAKHYSTAFQMEPEMPHYQLNLAAAHLKLNSWIDAEEACTRALAQHRSSKGLLRRAKARTMRRKYKDAISDYRALIRLQPHNTNAMIELLLLLYPKSTDKPPEAIDVKDTPWGVNLVPETEEEVAELYKKLGITRPKKVKPLPFERTEEDGVRIRIGLVVPPAATVLDANQKEGGDVVEGVNANENGVDADAKLKSDKVRGKERREEGGGSGIIRGILSQRQGVDGLFLLAWDKYVVSVIEG